MSEQSAVRPTPERHRHDIITIPERDAEHWEERPARIETQTQLDRYERRGLLCPGSDEDSRKQNRMLATAGRRYFEQAFKAGRVPSFCKPFAAERVDSSLHTEHSDTQLAAMHGRKLAQQALGTGLVPIADWVCINDYGADAWAVKKGQRSTSGITVLRLALTVLANHYGLVNSTDTSVSDIRHSPKLGTEKRVSA